MPPWTALTNFARRLFCLGTEILPRAMGDPIIGRFGFATSTATQWFWLAPMARQTAPGSRRRGGRLEENKASAWHQSSEQFELLVMIPANTTAEVYVPAKAVANVTECGGPAVETASVNFLRMEAHAAVFVAGGIYSFKSTR